MTTLRLSSPPAKQSWEAAAMTTAIHEAGHAIVPFLLGWEARDVVLVARYFGEPGDLRTIFSGYVGEHRPKREPALADIPVKETIEPDAGSTFCWRILFPSAVFYMAGPEAQRKFSGNARGDSGDERLLDNVARETLGFSGRDPTAFKRLARMAARRVILSPNYWRAIETLAQMTVRRLNLEELRADPQPGDLLEAVISAAEVERAFEQSCVRRGALAHWACCGGKCEPRKPWAAQKLLAGSEVAGGAWGHPRRLPSTTSQPV